MNYEIVEQPQFSGNQATIYTVVLDGDDKSLFDYFLEENIENNRKEVKSILSRLKEIGRTTGAREIFFKKYEGKPGDGVCALHDKKLRLYCIRYGKVAVILGSGGLKNVATWQDDDTLSDAAEIMIEISNDITKRLQDREIKWSQDGKRLLGNLKFTDDEQD